MTSPLPKEPCNITRRIHVKKSLSTVPALIEKNHAFVVFHGQGSVVVNVLLRNSYSSILEVMTYGRLNLGDGTHIVHF
jgi:hypothetical protein